jgi:thioredoxin reductase (NADPH)
MAEHHLNAVAFPTLDEAQMAALGRCPLTMLKRYRDEEKLFEACERDFKFFVVKSGKVEIRRRKPSRSTAPGSLPATWRN